MRSALPVFIDGPSGYQLGHLVLHLRLEAEELHRHGLLEFIIELRIEMFGHLILDTLEEQTLLIRPFANMPSATALAIANWSHSAIVFLAVGYRETLCAARIENAGPSLGSAEITSGTQTSFISA